VIGHLEWTTRKIDPRGFTMVSMRALVAAHLAAGPSTEDDVTTVDLSSTSIETVATRVLLKDNVIANPVEDDPNKFITLATSVRNIETVARRTETAVNALKVTGTPVTLTDEQTTAIATKVADLLAARLAS
jgi:hypothetical protein